MAKTQIAPAPKPRRGAWTSKDSEQLDALLQKLMPMLNDRTQIADLTKAIRAQAGCRRIADMLKVVKSAAEGRHNWLSTAVVPARMEEQEITKLNVKGTGLCYLKSDVYVSILKKNRKKAMQWFERNKPELVVDTINSSSLAAWVRTQIEKGKKIPKLVGVVPYTVAIINAAKSAE